MTTATVPTTDTPDTTTTKPSGTVSAARITAAGIKPNGSATRKPASADTDATKGAKLESIALKLRSQTITSAVKLAETFVALHPLAPWTVATDTRPAMTLEKYFRDVMGIGAGDDMFRLPYDARRAVVKGMFTRDNDPERTGDFILAIAAMTGASERTIARDRTDLGFANKNRVDSHVKQSGDGESDGENGEAQPAKAPKTRVQTVNVIAIIDELQDATYLMNVIAHASARLTALTTPATAKDAA